MIIDGLEVPLTNQDKIFFPQIGRTKGDLVRYYVSVAPYILNHVSDRPIQMKRYPNGVEGDFFYQKRVPVPHPEWLETVHVEFPSGRTADFPVLKNAAGMAWYANLGCIEVHTWHSRVSDVEKPDYLLIDLDPSEGNPWKDVREIALAAKDELDELGLPGYPKTSGVTGLHILVPIVVELPFPPLRELARAIAKRIEKRVPAISTTTWKVADRTGVFIDYGQNARDRTIASAYSIRPMADARASAPLRWDEVGAVEPADFTIDTMPARVAAVGDLTKDIWDHRVSLVPLFERLGVKLEAPKPRKRTALTDWRQTWRAKQATKKNA